MKALYKFLIALIKNVPLFSVAYLREFKFFLYRKLYNAPKMYVAHDVTIGIPHFNPEGSYFKCLGQVNISSYVYIDYSGGVEIDDMVAISENAKIFTHNHDVYGYYKDWTKNKIIFSSLYIGKYAWIGSGAIILPSVTHIAEGTVVAAGAVLTKNTEPYGIYAGNPAKKIGERKYEEA